MQIAVSDRMTRLAALVALIALGGAIRPAQADSLADVPEPGYARQAATGSETTERLGQIRQIEYPTLGLPALVPPGGEIRARVRADCPLEAGVLRAELALIGAEPALRIALEVRAVEARPGPPPQAEVVLLVPPDLGADVYDLYIAGAPCLDDHQPSSVRVHPSGTTFRFAVLSDQQVSDPTSRFEEGNRHGELFPQEADDGPLNLGLQIRRELEFLAPRFVLYPGDLVFGMDYAAEYAEAYEHWRHARLATFVVPGNHDGYALYRLQLAASWLDAAAEVLFCGRTLLDSPDLGAGYRLLSCMVKRLPGLVEQDLEHDGRELFQRFLGPERYAVHTGGLRLIGLNTYGGSRERRTAMAVSLQWLRKLFELVESVTDWDQSERKRLLERAGAPLIDNYGGFLEPASLDWARSQVSAARRAGEQVVLFGHHDPRGNLRSGADPYEENAPFPTNPVGLGDFEIWNFDGPDWDSNPGDTVGLETATDNTGTRLLGLLATGPAHYFCGHAHHDLHDFTRAGGRIRGGNGRVAEGDLHIVQTTTGGAGVHGDDAYRGYRIVEVRDGRITEVDYRPADGWGSVPAGNFWVRARPREDGAPDWEVTNGLPTPTRGRLRFDLDDAPGGYRFSADADELALTDLTLSDDRFIAYVDAEVPGLGSTALFPATAEALVTRTVCWTATPENQPPRAVIEVVGGDRRPRVVGAAVTLTATASTDPEGRPLFRHVWEHPGGRATGAQLTVAFTGAGAHPVTLTVFDAHGARGTTTREIVVETEAQQLARATAKKSKAIYAVVVALGLLVLLLLLARSSKRRRGNGSD